MAREARARPRAGRVQHDHARDRRARRRAAAAARDGGERLARAQYMESRDGKLVFRMDREALRRPARRGAVVAGAACRAARSVAQFPVQPPGSRRRPDGARHSPRLRRSSRTSCARISRSRWGCRSDMRSARAAAAASRRDVPCGGTFRTRNLRTRPPEEMHRVRRPYWRCFASRRQSGERAACGEAAGTWASRRSRRRDLRRGRRGSPRRSAII